MDLDILKSYQEKHKKSSTLSGFPRTYFNRDKLLHDSRRKNYNLEQRINAEKRSVDIGNRSSSKANAPVTSKAAFLQGRRSTGSGYSHGINPIGGNSLIPTNSNTAKVESPHLRNYDPQRQTLDSLDIRRSDSKRMKYSNKDIIRDAFNGSSLNHLSESIPRNYNSQRYSRALSKNAEILGNVKRERYSKEELKELRMGQRVSDLKKKKQVQNPDSRLRGDGDGKKKQLRNQRHVHPFNKLRSKPINENNPQKIPKVMKKMPNESNHKTRQLTFTSGKDNILSLRKDADDDMTDFIDNSAEHPGHSSSMDSDISSFVKSLGFSRGATSVSSYKDLVSKPSHGKVGKPKFSQTRRKKDTGDKEEDWDDDDDGLLGLEEEICKGDEMLSFADMNYIESMSQRKAFREDKTEALLEQARRKKRRTK